MWPIASGPFLRPIRRFSILFLVLAAASVFLLTKDKPYHKAYALSPLQVLSNQDRLRGQTVMVTGYVISSEGSSLKIAGHTGLDLSIRSSSHAPSKGAEVLARVHIQAGSGAVEAQEIYEYRGSTIHRVIYSALPIPFIALLFLREFRFLVGTFTFRTRS